MQQAVCPHAPFMSRYHSPRPEDTNALFSACNRTSNGETGFVTEVGLLRQCVRRR
jgi:hypothetical protein